MGVDGSGPPEPVQAQVEPRAVTAAATSLAVALKDKAEVSLLPLLSLNVPDVGAGEEVEIGVMATCCTSNPLARPAVTTVKV